MEENSEKTFIVTNGDVLTYASYVGILDFTVVIYPLLRWQLDNTR